jgi:hypothetical protein
MTEGTVSNEPERIKYFGCDVVCGIVPKLGWKKQENLLKLSRE